MLVRVIVAGLVALFINAGPAVADTNDSDLYAWGHNGSGQLGDGTNTARPAPVKVNTSGALAGKRIRSVSGGGSHSCVIAEGTVYCWGSNGQGQLGRSTGATTEPGPVAGLLEGRTVTSVSAGHQHTCAVADGQLFCWGWNLYGQLGSGAPTASATPIAVTSGALANKTITGVTAGWANTCATDSDGDAYCWGAGSIMGQPQPTLLVDGAAGPVMSLRSSEEHACYVQNERAYCGGNNAQGEVGNGSFSFANWTPVSTAGVLNGRSVTTVRTGKRFSCALADAKPFCWGDNYNGQLGIGVAGAPPYNSPVPVEVILPATIAEKPVTGLTAGEQFSCLIADGWPYCWGLGNLGQLGDGTIVSKASPTAVEATGVLAGRQARTFSAGADHMLFLAQQVPTTPRDVAASVSGTEATVSWQPPKDDGGRAVTEYWVSGGGSSCATEQLSCTVSRLAPGSEHKLQVVARNAIGDSAAGTVAVTTAPAPQAVVKSKQSFAAPKKLKKSGVTVVVKKGAKTSAGQPVTTKVKAKGMVKVIRQGGAVKVRTFGKNRWRVTVTLTAPGTATHEPFSQKVVYKRR